MVLFNYLIKKFKSKNIFEIKCKINYSFFLN